MEKKLLLYGNGEFTHLMKWYIENDLKREITAVTVESRFIKTKEFEGLEIIPFEYFREGHYLSKDYEILICVGYNQMNEIRERIFWQCKELGFKIANYIHSSAKIASNVKMGEGNIILEDSLIEPFVSIGFGNLIWYKTAIAHECFIGNFNTITGMSSISGLVQIGNNCFIGNNATIKDKIFIADYTLIGAGSYISKSTEPHSVYVPQRTIKLFKDSMDIEL